MQGSNESECARNVTHARALFTDLGFVINEDKSVIIPTQQLKFLGFILDSTLMRETLTPDKKERLITLCSSILAKAEITTVQLSQLIGTILSSLPGVEYGKLHYRQLEIDKNTPSSYIRVIIKHYFPFQSELRRWFENVQQSFNPISHGNPNMTLVTDASKLGLGAHIAIDGNITQGLWNIEEGLLHINKLEL